MENLQKLVSSHFQQAFYDAFPKVPKDQVVVRQIQQAKPQFGDFQCNALLPLFNRHKKNLAEVSVSMFEGCDSLVSMGDRLKSFMPSSYYKELDCNEQGFITCKVSDALLIKSCQGIINGPAKVVSENIQKVAVDYSSPNIAKEMHVGHLRSTIIGDAICRGLEAVGHEVERINHVGDWGTQFGMLIQLMKEEHPNFLEEPMELSDLNVFYKRAKERFDADADFKKAAQEQVYQLQTVRDPFARQSWKMFCEVSAKEFSKVYDRLQVDPRLEMRGESFYNDMIPEILEEVKEFTEVADGATCIFPFGKKKNAVPLMVVKSDGGYGYATSDMGAIRHRFSKGNKWLVYLTDIGQEPHFKLIFKAAEDVGWFKPKEGHRVDHCGFGLVLGEDGKKFKTRSGEVVKLVDLLDEAVDKARVEIEKRVENMSAEDKALIDVEQVAKSVGYGAVKYFDLRQFRTTNYKFSYDAMLDYNGNTAVYLLYAYARICSIFRKAGVDYNADANKEDLKITEPEERELLRYVLKYSEIMDQFERDLHVHRLCEYIFELCTTFTSFFGKCKVVGNENQNSRLIICNMTRKVMKNVLDIVGIQTLERI